MPNGFEGWWLTHAAWRGGGAGAARRARSCSSDVASLRNRRSVSIKNAANGQQQVENGKWALSIYGLIKNSMPRAAYLHSKFWQLVNWNLNAFFKLPNFFDIELVMHSFVTYFIHISCFAALKFIYATNKHVTKTNFIFIFIAIARPNRISVPTICSIYLMRLATYDTQCATLSLISRKASPNSVCSYCPHNLH